MNTLAEIEEAFSMHMKKTDKYIFKKHLTVPE